MSIFQAIINITNKSEFTLINDDLKTLVFNDSSIIAPTEEEINIEINRMAVELNAKKDAKVELLERLGITEEEAQLLLR